MNASSSRIYTIVNATLKSDVVFICANEEEAQNNYRLSKFFNPHSNTYFFPKWDTVPYDRVSPNKQILSDRAKILSKLASRRPNEFVIIFTSAANLLQKVPSKEVFTNKHLTVSAKHTIKQLTIIDFLVASGFIRVSTATEAGEFALRGDILDIVISNDESYRLNFDWENNVSIKSFDSFSQISSEVVDKFDIYPSSEMILSSSTIEHFKSAFLQKFGVNHSQNPTYIAISEGRHVAGAEHILSLCYDKMVNLTDYLVDPEFVNQEVFIRNSKDEIDQIEDFYQSRLETNRLTPSQFYPLLKPEMMYEMSNVIPGILDVIPAKAGIQSLDNLDSRLRGNDIDGAEGNTPNQLNFYSESQKLQHPVGDIFADFVHSHKTSKFIICCPSVSGAQKVAQILRLSDVEIVEISGISEVKPGQVGVANITLAESFESRSQYFIRQQDIIGLRRIRGNTSSSKKLKNILSELETLSEGELVVHSEHGIGRFEGVETIEVIGIRHDCIKIIYDGDDKLYIPVENLESIKKYGQNDAPLDKLGGVAWQRRKSKLKNRIGEIAQKLIKIAAERKLLSAEPIGKSERYDKFCAAFPYTETDDQLSAIADIENDLISGHPMDRLICGDVGFGKTEVAMRATFLAASHKKQVAVIVPTTILAKQHFMSFRERFASMGMKIVQVSRLTPRSEMTQIKADIRDGNVDIAIGTHALLSNDIKFQDLGMLIVDEEQHFGVLQKEKLKELKHGTHVLSLSATPIPRTLQMSMLGIRDLSLIATPPIDRLPIRTHVIPYDGVVVRDALLKEHARGGRSFYVAPRIADLEDLEKSLKVLVPELKYVVAHGQMAPSKINEIMEDFYDGKYDILLSTTIIESGIDIPAANTIIIHKAEMLGLSQLYQLRGRVGRSKLRGCAYLIIGNSRTVTQQALRRLEIMQNIDSLGAGFTIASYDSDLRGFGNLVGDEQSGHVREVGAELYQEMLEEAICALENNKPSEEFTPNINLGMPVFIPEEYIADNDQRFALYKRISLLKDEDEIENFHDELIDRFGLIPEPTQNLLYVVKVKVLCKKMGISDIDVGPNGMVIKFLPSEQSNDMVMKYVAKYPRHTKIRPDNKLAILSQGKMVDVHKVLMEMRG